jgi:hypothetical protein
MKILNLTQHTATPEQRLAGVIDLPEQAAAELRQLLTFSVSGPDGLVSAEDAYAKVLARADQIVELVVVPAIERDPEITAAMIGGAPYLMAPLERALMEIGVTPVYALSDRVSVEETQPDGTVRKVAVFRHAGFVAVD